MAAWPHDNGEPTMDPRRNGRRTDGGLMALAALSFALLISGLPAALPKGARTDGRPSPSRRVDVSLSMPQIAQSYGTPAAGRSPDLATLLGLGSKPRNPVKHPPSTSGIAQARAAGRWE
jgi:hypothetical protein